MKKILLSALFMLMAFAGAASAYDINYSYVDSEVFNDSCPASELGPVIGRNVTISTKAIGCRKREANAKECGKKKNGDPKTCTFCDCKNKGTQKMVAPVQYQFLNSNDYFTTNMCYRLSCYYQAMAYADLNYVVQPLNKHANIVTSIIAGYASDGRLTQPIGVNGKASDVGLGFVSNNGPRYTHNAAPLSASPRKSNGAAYRHYQNGKYNTLTPGVRADEIVASPASVAAYEPGGGTSAYQGLLWSWRILSAKWQGKWAAQSFYERNGIFPDGTADRVEKLPSAELSKHIIIISDGLDNDGTSNPEAVAKASEIAPKGNFAAVVAASGFGFEFRRESAVNNPSGETCDAHGPQASITTADYVRMCEEMNEQGVTVYAIVFDNAVNDKLKSCVLSTARGVYIDNMNICSGTVTTPSRCQPNPTGVASPDYLRDALANVFAAIAAQSVKLVE